MARHGFKMIDAEMHVMEPVDLWERYIDLEFKARAPRRLNERRWDIRAVVGGEVMATMPGGDWLALSYAKAIFLRPNIFNHRSWHDVAYDPLGGTCQELNVAVGFH